MDTLLIGSMGLLPLAMISFVFGSSTYSSMPGAKVDLGVLGEDELLPYQRDKQQYAMLQDKHREAARFVALANHSYRTQSDLEAASQALFNAVECYEEIREQAASAVVELNIAILAKARLKVELERGANQELIAKLKKYFDNAVTRANWFSLKHHADGRYDDQVEIYRNKLEKYKKNVGK